MKLVNSILFPALAYSAKIRPTCDTAPADLGKGAWSCPPGTQWNHGDTCTISGDGCSGTVVCRRGNWAGKTHKFCQSTRPVPPVSSSGDSRPAGDWNCRSNGKCKFVCTGWFHHGKPYGTDAGKAMWNRRTSEFVYETPWFFCCPEPFCENGTPASHPSSQLRYCPDHVCIECDDGFELDSSGLYIDCVPSAPVVDEYQCDAANWVPDADDVVIGEHGTIYTGLTQIDSLFARSAAGAAFLNKFTNVHTTYGFREHTTNNCIVCTSDNKNISPDGVEHDFMMTSTETLEYRNCGELVNYRPMLCQDLPYQVNGVWHNLPCGIDWEAVTTTNDFSDRVCANTQPGGLYSANHGVFVNTEVYDRIRSACGPFVAIRQASIGGGDAPDVDNTTG